MLINITKVGVKRMDQTLFGGAQQQDEGQQAQTETQEVPSEYEEKLLSFEVPEPGPGCPERLWSLLLCRHSKPAWTCSCATSPRHSCSSRGIGLDDLLRSLPIPNIL